MKGEMVKEIIERRIEKNKKEENREVKYKIRVIPYFEKEKEVYYEDENRRCVIYNFKFYIQVEKESEYLYLVYADFICSGSLNIKYNTGEVEADVFGREYIIKENLSLIKKYAEILEEVEDIIESITTEFI